MVDPKMKFFMNVQESYYKNYISLPSEQVYCIQVYRIQYVYVSDTSERNTALYKISMKPQHGPAL